MDRKTTDADLDAEIAKGQQDRLENAPPIGMGPSGELNIVSEDEINEDDISDLDDYDELFGIKK